MYSLRSPEEASGYIKNCSQLDMRLTLCTPCPSAQIGARVSASGPSIGAEDSVSSGNGVFV